MKTKEQKAIEVLADWMAEAEKDENMDAVDAFRVAIAAIRAAIKAAKKDAN